MGGARRGLKQGLLGSPGWDGVKRGPLSSAFWVVGLKPPYSVKETYFSLPKGGVIYYITGKWTKIINYNHWPQPVFLLVPYTHIHIMTDLCSMKGGEKKTKIPKSNNRKKHRCLKAEKLFTQTYFEMYPGNFLYTSIPKV